MSRLALDDEQTPVPRTLASSLPAVYLAADPNIQLFCAGLDRVLLPVWQVLDNLDAYFDPSLAPSDFVAALADWVGLELDDNFGDTQRRAMVAGAVRLYRWRGTRRGLIDLVRAATGTDPVEISDSGTSTWQAADSPRPAAGPGQAARPWVRVQVQVAPGMSVDRDRLTRLITASLPLHVTTVVEFL